MNSWFAFTVKVWKLYTTYSKHVTSWWMRFGFSPSGSLWQQNHSYILTCHTETIWHIAGKHIVKCRYLLQNKSDGPKYPPLILLKWRTDSWKIYLKETTVTTYWYSISCLIPLLCTRSHSSPPVQVGLAVTHHERWHLKCGEDQQHLRGERKRKSLDSLQVLI